MQAAFNGLENCGLQQIVSLCWVHDYAGLGGTRSFLRGLNMEIDLDVDTALLNFFRRKGTEIALLELVWLSFNDLVQKKIPYIIHPTRP